jgi:hypothetical protein
LGGFAALFFIAKWQIFNPKKSLVGSTYVCWWAKSPIRYQGGSSLFIIMVLKKKSDTHFLRDIYNLVLTN